MLGFAIFITILGAFMTTMGGVIKKQMMLADSFTPSPKQERARQFIDNLINIADGDIWKVFKYTQAIFILGLLLCVFGGTVLMVGTF